MTTPSRRPMGRPPGADSRERRDQIVNAAMRRFASLGYANTTMSAVAADVGITLAALYYYFGSKAELYQAVFDETSERHWQGLLDDIGEAADFVTLMDRWIDQVRLARRTDARRFLINVPIEAARNPELAPVLERREEIQDKMFALLVGPAWERGELERFSSFAHAVEALRLVVIGWAIEANYVPEQADDAVEAVRALVRAMVSPKEAPRAT